MVETLLEKQAQWMLADGPDADIAITCECRLARNLADYPFPGQCSDREKETILDRVAGVLGSLGILSTGQFWSLDDLGGRDAKLLEERRLISRTLVDGTGSRGVYISEDQALSVSINDDDHLTIRGVGSGLNLQDVWARVNLVDDALAGVLDYAFSERLGFLTSSVHDVGTGLKAGFILNIPGLIMKKELDEARAMVMAKRHTIEGLFSSKGLAPGELFVLSSDGGLGRSEAEIVYHVKHLASEVIARERDARSTLASEAPLEIEDRVGRALGVARGARLVAFNEALALLSSLRLGVSSGLLDQITLHQVNDVFMACQSAHIRLKCGRDCDELTLSAERADLFRARFA